MLTTDNCYVTVSGADMYFGDQLNRDSWFLFVDKDKALISATSILDNVCTYPGYKTDSTQPLGWPRTGTDCPGVTTSGIPQEIEVATYELAYQLTEGDTTAPNGMAGYKQVEVGSLNVVADDTTRQKTPISDYIWSVLGCTATNPTGGIIPIFRQ